jgi:hypothetical protein
MIFKRHAPSDRSYATKTQSKPHDSHRTGVGHSSVVTHPEFTNHSPVTIMEALTSLPEPEPGAGPELISTTTIFQRSAVHTFLFGLNFN